MAQEAILTKKDGVIQLTKSFDFMCSQLRNGKYRLKIERFVEPRSLSQNALLWLWLTCMENETGTNRNDFYAHYCKLFLSRPVCINGVEEVVTDGTSSLNTLQMTDFLNKVQADAASEFGIVLPLPADRYYMEFINEYKDRR